MAVPNDIPRSTRSNGKPYDATTKTLIGTRPRDWLRFLGIPDDLPVELIDGDVSVVSGSTDGLLRIGGETPFGLHIEFETRHAGHTLPDRLVQYNVNAGIQNNLVFRSVAVLLTAGADSPALSGNLEKRLPDGTVVLTFAYTVVRVWHIPAETFLASGFGLLPFAPIGDVSQTDLPGVIGNMEARVEAAVQAQQITNTEANDLWAATFILMGSRYERALLKQLLKGVGRMRDSVAYQMILEEGEAKGEEKGKAKGRLEGVRETIFRIGTKRFGKPSDSVRSAIEAVDSFERLEELAERLLEVETWDEFLLGI